jgi:hypothetical protein
MSMEVTKATAEKLVAGCREGREAEGLDTLYAPDAVSVEAMPMPGGSAESVGVEAIKGKHAWWGSSFEMHGGSVEGPFVHGADRFAVIFEMDVTEKATGKRSKGREVAIYTVNDAGKIVREEFYYAA